MVVFDSFDEVDKIVHSSSRCKVNTQEMEQVGGERKHTWKEGGNYNTEFLKWSNNQVTYLLLTKPKSSTE